MSPERTLGEFEQIVLLAVLRLGDEAYGVTILDEIAARTGRNPAPGALYTTLHRMEDKGLVTFRDGSPTPERGGRAKRFVTVTREGRNALASAQSAYQSLLQGLDLLDAKLLGGGCTLVKTVRIFFPYHTDRVASRPHHRPHTRRSHPRRPDRDGSNPRPPLVLARLRPHACGTWLEGSVLVCVWLRDLQPNLLFFCVLGG